MAMSILFCNAPQLTQLTTERFAYCLLPIIYCLLIAFGLDCIRP